MHQMLIKVHFCIAWAGVLERAGYIYFPDHIYKPDIFTLGMIPESIVHHGSMRRLVDTSILQIKRLISLYWKKQYNNMSFCLEMEKIIYMLKGKLGFWQCTEWDRRRLHCYILLHLDKDSPAPPERISANLWIWAEYCCCVWISDTRWRQKPGELHQNTSNTDQPGARGHWRPSRWTTMI